MPQRRLLFCDDSRSQNENATFMTKVDVYIESKSLWLTPTIKARLDNRDHLKYGERVRRQKTDEANRSANYDVAKNSFSK